MSETLTEAIEEEINAPLPDLPDNRSKTMIESAAELGAVVSKIEIPTLPQRKKRFSTAELLTADFPEPTWAIPGLIPEGLDILGGRPKIGKSWMLMQIAHSVGTGGMFFNQKVDPGNVLYIAFEDSPRRIKDRAATQGIPNSADIDWAFEWPPFTGPGIDQLLIEIQNQKLRMVIIDTMKRGMPGLDPKKDLKDIERIYGLLQVIALENGVVILTSDHTRKPFGADRDPIDDIIDSTSKTAIADATFALYKQRGKSEAYLMGRGRDIEDIDLTLNWDGLTCSWQSLGNSDDVLINKTETEVMAGIMACLSIGELPTITNIAGHADMAKPNISRTISILLSKGQIHKADKVGREVPYYPIDNNK